MCVSPHLMVPVGEGSGEPNALMCSSCCCIVGMLIFRGEMWGRSGRGGREGCSLSLSSSGSSSDINWILITVLGKRNTHLESRKARRGDGERAEGHLENTHQDRVHFLLHHIIVLSILLNLVCAVLHLSDLTGPQTTCLKTVVQNFFLQPSSGESTF